METDNHRSFRPNKIESNRSQLWESRRSQKKKRSERERRDAAAGGGVHFRYRRYYFGRRRAPCRVCEIRRGEVASHRQVATVRLSYLGDAVRLRRNADSAEPYMDAAPLFSGAPQLP